MNFQAYRVPFLLSLGLHSLLLVGLFSFDATPTPKAPSKASPPTSAPVVQAIAVNPQQIQSQVEQIKAAEQAKAETERQRQENLKKQADMAEKKRKQEEDRFSKIKEAQKKVEQEQAVKQKAAAAELEKLKKQQVEEKKKLATEKTKQATKEAKEKALQEKLASEEQPTKNTKTDKTAKNESNETQLQGEIDKYQGMILQAIAQQWIIPDNANQDASAKLLIHLAPGGMVLDVKLVTSSKDPALDRSAIAAVHKASPLPVPTDSDIFDKFREFTLTVQPKDVIGR